MARQLDVQVESIRTAALTDMVNNVAGELCREVLVDLLFGLAYAGSMQMFLTLYGARIGAKMLGKLKRKIIYFLLPWNLQTSQYS